jgi:hypothetical protein
VADLYAVADALILPSASEGFGCRCSKPSLACRCVHGSPVLREVVGTVAHFVPLDGDATAFAEAVEAAIEGSPIARLAGHVRRVRLADHRHRARLPAILG